MKLDRELQHRILDVLADAYPTASAQVVDNVSALVDDERLIANLLYLESHGLLTAGLSSYLGGETVINASQLKITHKGLDFLADDGGLTAILGVVTVRLHADTVKELLTIEINHSYLAPADKKRFVDQIRQLPVESTKTLVNTLVAEGAKAALQKGPQALQWLHTLMDSL